MSLEVRVSELEADHAALEDSVAALSQDLLNKLELHSVRITSNKVDTAAAQGDATTALTTIYNTGLQARFYTDDEIQALRDEFFKRVGDLEAALTSHLDAEITTQVDAVYPVVMNEVNAKSAEFDALADSIGLDMNNIVDVNDEILLNQLPGVHANIENLAYSQMLLENEYGVVEELEAAVQQTSIAIADVKEGLKAGYLIKAQAGGAISLLALIATDGTEGPYSIAKISADDIILDGTVYTPHLKAGAVTSDKVNTGSFGVAGIAVFGGKLRSTNYDPGKTGWLINNDGSAEFNGVVISRQMLIASGSEYVGNLSTTTSDSFKKTDEIWINTGVATTAWSGAKETMLALVGRGGSGGIEAYNKDIKNKPTEISWGFTGEVVPVTNWHGPHNLWIRVDFFTRNVVSATDFSLDWKLMKVT